MQCIIKEVYNGMVMDELKSFSKFVILNDSEIELKYLYKSLYLGVDGCL